MVLTLHRVIPFAASLTKQRLYQLYIALAKALLIAFDINHLINK